MDSCESEHINQNGGCEDHAPPPPKCAMGRGGRWKRMPQQKRKQLHQGTMCLSPCNCKKAHDVDRTTTSQSQVNHIGSDGASNPMESSTGRMEFENVSNTKPDNARMGSGSLVHEKDSDETLKISMS